MCGFILTLKNSGYDNTNTLSWLWEKNLRSDIQNNQFYKNDLDLDPITLVLKLNPDMLKMYYHTVNEVSMSRHSKVIARTDTHTGRQYENITFLHMWAVKIEKERYTEKH